MLNLHLLFLLVEFAQGWELFKHSSGFLWSVCLKINMHPFKIDMWRPTSIERPNKKKNVVVEIKHFRIRGWIVCIL